MAVPAWLKRMFVADLAPRPEAFSLGTWQPGAEPEIAPTPPESTVLARAPDNVAGTLTASLEENIRWIKQHFHLTLNKGMVLRPLRVGEPPTDAMVIYMDDQVDWEHLNRAVITPLLREPLPRDLVLNPTSLIREVLTEGRVSATSDWQKVTDAILMGSAILLMDGVSTAVSLEAKGWAMR
ncbi:MAG TPA: spore germination protein, partial [Symbiobacteriaceae bacterium]|nr:spore germination protein [Symbiobacteriaceae bacterium]